MSEQQEMERAFKEEGGTEGDERGLKSFITNVVKNKTTPKPPSTPELDADVAKLDQAFKGIGTKEELLISVLCTKPASYIQQLRAVYDHAHNMDLLSKIQLETSGRFQKVLEAMICNPNELRALYVHKAVAGIGTDEMMLIDVIMTATNAQIEDMKVQYKKHFLIPMQLRVDLDTSGKFQGVLDAILNGKRPEGGIQQEHVEADLELLFKSTEGKLGTNEKAILNIIATRTKAHLEHLNEKFKERSPKHHSFVDAIKGEISGFFWVQKAFIAAFLPHASWHAWRLHMEMAGLGTDEDGLMRSVLVPTPSELKAAARIMWECYKENLQARIKSEMWGDASKALQAYVNAVLAGVVDPGDKATAGPNYTPEEAAQLQQEGAKVGKPGLTTGQKVGIGVGVGAAALLVTGAAVAVGVKVHQHNEEKKQQEAAAAAAAANNNNNNNNNNAPVRSEVQSVQDVKAEEDEKDKKKDKKDKKSDDEKDKKDKKKDKKDSGSEGEKKDKKKKDKKSDDEKDKKDKKKDKK